MNLSSLVARMLHKTARIAGQATHDERQCPASHLAELGLVVAKGIGRIDELKELAEKRCVFGGYPASTR